MKKYFNIVLLTAVVTGLTSCLKDNSVNLDTSNTPAVVEWSTSAGDTPAGTNSSGFTRYTRSYDAGPNAQATFTVNYAGADAAPSDITVNLGVDESAVTKFNNATTPAGTYTVLPSSLYTIPASVVIPQGQRKATVTVSLKTNQFDFTKSYILPIAIKSTTAGAVSGNYGTILVSVSAKNAYDGLYDAKGFVLRNSAAGPDLSLGGFFKGQTYTLSTLGLTQNAFTPFWASGGGIAGIDGINLVVNPTTNKVTVTATGNATLRNITGYDSRYEPSTKTFYLSYTWGTAPNNRAITDTLTYKGPR
jgi:hypothetical protein